MVIAFLGAVPSTDGPAVEIARTAEEVEAFRFFFKGVQWHPEADIDCQLAALNAMGSAASPYVMMLRVDNQPKAMLVGRIVDTVRPWKIGYLPIGKSRVRILEIVYGGTLGDLSYPNSVALCRELEKCLARGDADVVMLNHVRKDSDFFRAATTVPGFLSRDHFIAPNLHWRLPLPQTFDEFLKQQSKKARSEFRYYANRLNKNFRVEVRCFREAEEVDQGMDDVEMVAALTYHRGLGSGFQHTPVTRAKWLLSAERKWLRAYVLYLDGKPSAFYSGHVYKGVFFGESTGYDPQHADYNPGTFLMVHIIEALCGEASASAWDHGFGDAHYKRRFGAVSWEEMPFFIFSKSFKGMQFNIMRGLSMGVSHLIRDPLDRLGVTGSLKTRWRKYLAGRSSRNSPGNEAQMTKA
jgi:hypothetical protein